MSTRESYVGGRDLSRTILLTAGWIAVTLGWMTYAWGRYSIFQMFAGVAITTLLFAAIAGVNWVSGRGSLFAIRSTVGWLSFVIYWIAFVRGRFSLLQNVGVLAASFVIFVVINAVTWVFPSRGDDR